MHKNTLYLQQYIQQPHSAPAKMDVGFATGLYDCNIQLHY